MKKSLLIMAALVGFSASGMAQKAVAQKINKQMLLPMAVNEMKDAQLSKRDFSPVQSRRSVANGVFYYRPSGTYYMTFEDTEENAFCFLVVPGFTELAYENGCSDTSTPITWDANYKENTINDNGDLIEEYNPIYCSTWADGQFYPYSIPVMTQGNYTYSMSEGTANMASDGIYVINTESTEFSNVDTNRGGQYQGSLVNSGTDNEYLDPYFGTSRFAFDIDGDGTADNLQCTGVFQVYEKPASPLVLESITVPITTNSVGKMVAENVYEANCLVGSEIICEIRNVKAVEYNGNYYYQPGDEIIGTMELRSQDVPQVRKFTNAKAYYAYAQFANWKTDVTGAEEMEPIVIDQPFSLYFYGFDGRGVDVGFSASFMGEIPAESWQPRTEIVVSNVDTGEFYGLDNTIGYGSKGQMVLYFDGYMDAAKAWDTFYFEDTEGNQTELSGFEWMRVDETDGVVYSDLSEENERYAQNTAVFGTVMPWYNEDGEENYQLLYNGKEEIPSWLNVLDPEEETPEEQYSCYFTDFYFEANQNAGVNGRAKAESPSDEYLEVEDRSGYYVKLTLKGKAGDVVSEDKPVYIIKGDLTHEDVLNAIAASGIENAIADRTEKVQSKQKGTFNLAGQRVNDSYKGIVIKDGKKMIRK